MGFSISSCYHLLNVSVTLQAYLEFFTCKEVVDVLLEVLKEYPQVNYHVVNCEVSLDQHLDPVAYVLL